MVNTKVGKEYIIIVAKVDRLESIFEELKKVEGRKDIDSTQKRKILKQEWYRQVQDINSDIHSEKYRELMGCPPISLSFTKEDLDRWVSIFDQIVHSQLQTFNRKEYPIIQQYVEELGKILSIIDGLGGYQAAKARKENEKLLERQAMFVQSINGELKRYLSKRSLTKSQLVQLNFTEKDLQAWWNAFVTSYK